jgi:hypothetical protein
MGLQDRYKSLTGASPASPAPAPASVAPSTPPAATSTPAASAAVVSSSPAVATAPTTTPTPARRDLTALRQKLAGGNGGVNPPEAAAAVKDDMLDVTTKETPDGGAEPLPNHPDAAKAAVVAPAPTSSPSTDDAPAKRKRRTKAEMEAARAAEAAAAGSTPMAGVSTTPAPAPSVEAEPEFDRELSAASAETAGFTILTDEVRAQLVADIRQDLLQNLSLQGAIELVRERMFPGMKTLEIEK